jgi:cytochrome c-type biogenesis protein CcmH/NrfG
MELPDDPWEAAQEGAELLADGAHDAAISELLAVLERQPSNAYAYFFLGGAYYEKEQYAQAMRAYVEALTLSPEYLGAMVNLGHSLRMLGRYSDAIRMGNQILAREPRDPDALYLIGSSHFAQGNDAAAHDFLQRFLDSNPEVEAAQEAVGMLEMLAGRVTDLN